MFSGKLKEIRKNKKITQKELSEKTGLSISYIQQLEYGIKENPSLETITNIAKALEIPANMLTDFDSDISRRAPSVDSHGATEEDMKSLLAKVIFKKAHSDSLDEVLLNSLIDDCLNYIEFLIYKLEKNN